MYMKGLEEGLALFQAKVSQISVISKVRADFTFVEERETLREKY